MTTRQLPLLTILPSVLRPAQQAAWDLIRQTPGGVTADEIGALLHSQRTDGREHSVDERCEWCAQRGMSLAKSKALKPLIVRRKGSGKYEPRDPKQRAKLPSSQLAELPDNLFGVPPNGDKSALTPNGLTEPSIPAGHIGTPRTDR